MVMQASRRAKRAARQLFRLCLVDGALDDERVRRVARQLAGSQRRGVVPILVAFRRLVRLDCSRRAALVESAVPLPGSLRQRVESGLVHTYGGGLATSYEVNPALIGGMRIKVGSDVYDGSLRARFAALEALL
jgi:F-type H+-transporting ATPase subunit delta